MTNENPLEAAEVLAVVVNILGCFDEINANIAINALQIAMMIVVYRANDGDMNECLDDLDVFNDNMKRMIGIIGPIQLPNAEFTVEKYN